jgi:hypothetical protein
MRSGGVNPFYKKGLWHRRAGKRLAEPLSSLGPVSGPRVGASHLNRAMASQVGPVSKTVDVKSGALNERSLCVKFQGPT